MNREVRVRFAPSPTGPLHIGGVRTALYNYLFARKHGGKCILRIEDTDQERLVAKAEAYIIESLTWVGIQFDEGIHVGGPHAPYRQSDRKPLYKQYADYLIAQGHAYYAFDTSEELDTIRKQMEKSGNHSWMYNNITRVNMKNSLSLPQDEVAKKLENGDPYTIRLKVPRNEEIRINDMIRGIVVVNSNNIDDKVLFKSDGMPTYHLANVVDDYLMKISHVIRGEEWLPSAPCHVLLYKFLGWEDVMPEFAHLPLLLKPNGNGKLSKRDGDDLGFPVFPLQWTDPKKGEISSGYRESGWFPEAVVNLVALLGWHPADNKEVFSMDELIEAFSLDRVSKSGAKFDVDKARWFNQHYLRQHSNADLAAIIQPMLKADGLEVNNDLLEKVIEAQKERAIYPRDIYTEGKFFFSAPQGFDADLIHKKWKEGSTAMVLQLVPVFTSIVDFNAAVIETTLKKYLEENHIGIGAVMPLIRILLTGGLTGPAVFDIAAILGKDETIRRIENGVNLIAKN
jgi:glutamyl-tRNA synthetase